MERPAAARLGLGDRVRFDDHAWSGHHPLRRPHHPRRARTILEETGQLSEVARRLGLSSLDSAASLASLDWLPEETETT
ncbi:hypothetical protein AB0I02_22040 [Streptomyces phaeochromogenes]